MSKVSGVVDGILKFRAGKQPEDESGTPPVGVGTGIEVVAGEKAGLLSEITGEVVGNA